MKASRVRLLGGQLIESSKERREALYVLIRQFLAR